MTAGKLPVVFQPTIETPEDTDRLLGLDNPAGKTRLLTDDEYKALTPGQQAGVDFNTLLTRAVQEDLAAAKTNKLQAPTSWGTMGDPSVAAQNTKYAPRTMKLLTSIGYQDPETSLDDFLQLKTAVQDNELALLDQGDISYVDPKVAGSYRDEFQRTLTQQFEKAFKKGSSVNTMMAQRSDLLGLPQVPGFGSGPEDIKFQQGFDLMARAGSYDNQEQVRSILQQSLGTKDQFARFLQYVDARSKQAELKNQPLGMSDGATYYDAAEFRKIYGLGGRG